MGKPDTSYKTTQSLLREVGYPIVADGKWGPQSQAALGSFQRAFNPYRSKRDPSKVFGAGVAHLKVDHVPGELSVAALRLSAANRGQLSLNFFYYEFACGHGKDGYCGGWMEVPHALLTSAEIIRDVLYVPRNMGMEIIGGSRCEKRNDLIIKGAKDSNHLHKNLGNALDPNSYFTWQQHRDARAGITAYEVRAGHGDACFHFDDRPGDPNHPQVFGWAPKLLASKEAWAELVSTVKWSDATVQAVPERVC
jgi:peptidoglycan hydrolase-like protein with peptidoglycan-binding domain